jgi:PIN domain
MVPSLRDVVEQEADRLRADLRALMAQSSIKPPVDHSSDHVVFITTKPYEWAPLPAGAGALQTRLRRRHREFAAVVDTILADQPPTKREDVATCHAQFVEVVDQDDATPFETIEQAERHALASLTTPVKFVELLSVGDSDEVILVPDTNAVYARPTLEDWAYDECPRFAVALVPAVLSELDDHKDHHNNPDVREKARGLVRRIGEYRRRGSLADGVTLRNGRSRIFSWAREPQMGSSLPWLDGKRNDDRLLASALEIARAYALCPTAIVTRDVNLQTKCDLARLPVLQPPN